MSNSIIAPADFIKQEHYLYNAPISHGYFFFLLLFRFTIFLIHHALFLRLPRVLQQHLPYHHIKAQISYARINDFYREADHIGKRTV